MEESTLVAPKKFKCESCEYETPFKSNYNRHIKTHKNKEESINPNPINNENNPDEEIDIEDFITERVNQLISDNQISNVKIPKSAVANLFKGNLASFVAGGMVGYILTGYLPVIMAMVMNMKKKTIAQQSLVVIPPPPPQSLNPVPQTQPPLSTPSPTSSSQS